MGRLVYRSSAGRAYMMLKPEVGILAANAARVDTANFLLTAENIKKPKKPNLEGQESERHCWNRWRGGKLKQARGVEDQAKETVKRR